MKRWHLTFGLASLALGAAYLAPRLAGWRAPAAEVVPQVDEPPPVVIAEVPPPPQAPSGHLVVDAGFDRGAVLGRDTAERYLTIEVSAPDDAGVAVRRPVDLAVVMDTSGSMSATGKIDQAKRAARTLAEQMLPGDTYSLTVFNDDAVLVVPSTPVDNPRAIGLAIDRIYEGGGTNLYAGMERGANEVRRTRRQGSAARVVLLSDGKANVGVTDDNALVRFAADLAGDGVALSAVGLGLDYNEDLLGRLADVGGGTYAFVDDASQLVSVFEDELARTASVVATGTLVHVELPEGMVPVEVIGWDARKTDHGWDVFVGDVYAGETKKIVTRVRVDGPGLVRAGYGCDGIGGNCGPSAVASAHYDDVADGTDAVTQDEAMFRVTQDARVVDASLDRERSVDATRAVGGQFLDMSTRAYEQGDRSGSVRLAEEGVQMLRRASADLSEPGLARDAADLEGAQQVYEMFAPASAPARRAIKENKELFRDRAR